MSKKESMSMIKVTSFGAARTTTGSRHLVEFKGKNILLDCGLFEGKRFPTYEKNRNFIFSPAEIDCVVLSHSHIDHSGNLPNLCSQGFSGNIYSTFATRDLCGIMLKDSAKVQASDTRFVNKRRAKKGEEPILPLYNEREAEAAMRQFVAINYHRSMPLCDGVSLTFFDAGHLLGSAQVLLEFKDGNKKLRLLFSGDIGRGNNLILRDPESVPHVDALIVESTYGNREHSETVFARDKLCRVINETAERGGRVVIPSFAVGRAQTIIYSLHQARNEGCYKSLPIYLDSPLSINATEVHRLHPECFNEEIYEFLHSKQDPFGWNEVHYTRSADDSKRINELKKPCIIISASGMCEAGRILHHLRNCIQDERNTILFVGYSAQHTLGFCLLRGDKKVNIFGEPFNVKAHIEKIETYSGHADRSELLRYVQTSVSGPKRKIILVHGEPEQCEGLKTALDQSKGSSEIIIAEEGKSITIPLH